MRRDDLMLVEVRAAHDDRSTGQSHAPGQRYTLSREKAELRQKHGLVAILRVADRGTGPKRKGPAPENKMVAEAPENKTLAANTRAELIQLAEGLGVAVQGGATKQQIIQGIIEERAALAAKDQDDQLDAEAVKGGAVKE